MATRWRDETCDPSIRSWVRSANLTGSDFPIQNLPLGIVRATGSYERWRPGVAIGERILDLGACAESGLLGSLSGTLLHATTEPTLNALLATGPDGVGALRLAVHRLLRDDAGPAVQSWVERFLLNADGCEHALPVSTGSFTDFFSSVHHAAHVARLRNPDAPLPAAYPYAPLAYEGRASALLLGGTPITRPHGPRRAAGGAVYAPTERLDYEVEVGVFIGTPSAHGSSVDIRAARNHIGGVSLLNDWTARDVQSFESQPLGPFLAKGFASSLSPWVLTPHALEPFRIPAAARPNDVPSALPHLVHGEDQTAGAWTITLECWLTTKAMREERCSPLRLSQSDAGTLFWTPAQLIAHQTSNGSPIRTGDLLGTGTISGPDVGSFGSLVEITRGGREPITLPTGETRGYLADEDEVTITAFCSAPGAVRIGFGACRGRISPALHRDDL